MPLNVIINGVGGQGNVLASQIVGRAAVNSEFKVTIGETFGLSQRGGPVMSHIRLSKDKNYGPLIPPNMCHIMVGLEPLETLRILREYGNEKTTLIVNARPIYPLNVIAGDVDYPDVDEIRSILSTSAGRLYWLDATPMAIELGGPILLNTILLGSLSALSDFPLAIEDFKEVYRVLFSESKFEANNKALEIGEELIRRHEN